MGEGMVVLGYVVTYSTLVGYTISLWLRHRRVSAALKGHMDD